jgi:hypothetical protein
MFTDMFEAYNKTAAVGPYLSCEFTPHIQSSLLVVDERGLASLKSVFTCPHIKYRTRLDWIIDTEVRLGKVILDSGYEMRGLMANRVVASSLHSVNSSTCASINPTKFYPISRDYKSFIYNHHARKRRFELSLYFA